MGEQSRPNCEFYALGIERKYARKLTYTPAIDEPAVVDGAPMSIQVFTNKLRDEECLQVAAVVDQALRKRL